MMARADSSRFHLLQFSHFQQQRISSLLATDHSHTARCRSHAFVRSCTHLAQGLSHLGKHLCVWLQRRSGQHQHRCITKLILSFLPNNLVKETARSTKVPCCTFALFFFFIVRE